MMEITRIYPHLPSVVAVFRLWHFLQSDCQFDSFQKRLGSPLWGMTWSTTVAAVSRPTRSHPAQIG